MTGYCHNGTIDKALNFVAIEVVQIKVRTFKIWHGGAFHIPIIRVSHIKDAIYFLKSINVKVFGCSEKADAYIGNIDFKRSLGIVMGNENKGISRGVLEICDELIKIPINQLINSYNVSVACSIVLYEYLKQNT